MFAKRYRILYILSIYVADQENSDEALADATADAIAAALPDYAQCDSQSRNSVTPLARSARHTSRHSKNTTFFVTSRHWAKTKIVTSLVVTLRHTIFETSHS